MPLFDEAETDAQSVVVPDEDEQIDATVEIAVHSRNKRGRSPCRTPCHDSRLSTNCPRQSACVPTTGGC
ncbi:MAG: hypothetical protein M5U09_21470 [Gammaproteobacteria bacterium]|nr:hypothetical protein [Gammaproteobacteria bacterium]